MKYSFCSLSVMEYVGVGFSNKGETVYWWILPNNQGWVGLTARKEFVEYRDDNPADDFDFIAADELEPVYYPV